ncbi:hypothetical protein [Vibrio mediterranei]|uniref:hypothetical protein n=1 Tax=Vibrio mediterranei TaxID=689 RepID=UPI00406795EE
MKKETVISIISYGNQCFARGYKSGVIQGRAEVKAIVLDALGEDSGPESSQT